MKNAAHSRVNTHEEMNHVTQKLTRVGCLAACLDTTIVIMTRGRPIIPPEMWRARNAPVSATFGRDIARS